LRKRTINLVVIFACLLFIFLTLIPLFLSYYVGPKITRQVLVKEVEDLLQKTVEVEGAGITIFGGFGVEFKNLRLLERDGSEFFRAKSFLLKPWIKSLVVGRLKWKRIVLEDPSIHLIRTPEGHINVGQTTEEKANDSEKNVIQQLQGMTGQLPSHVFIRGGRIRFTDLALAPDPVVTEMHEIEVTSQKISPRKPISFRLAGRFAGDLEETFSISSKVVGIEESQDPSELEFQISIEASGIDSRRLWPYVQSAMPFDSIRGLLDVECGYRGRLTSFHSSGAVRIRDGQFTIPTLYTAPIEPEEASLSYEIDYEGNQVQISHLELRTPRVSIDGSGFVQEVSSNKRSICLELATKRTSLRDIRGYLPDKIIPKKLASLLTERGIKGFFQVEKARLEGPWADLNLEGLRKNPQMLSVHARFDACTLFVDPKLPRVQNISGLLTLEGHEARITGFHGEFLRSRIHDLNGSIHRVYTHPTMAVNFKGDLDLKGLHSLLKTSRATRDLRKALEPIVKISGKARLKGEIQHDFKKTSALTYKGKISLKNGQLGIAELPIPLTNIEGEIQCDEKEIRLSRFTWKMGKSLCRGQVSLRGYLRKQGKKLTLSKKPKIALDMRAEEMTIDHLLSKGGRKPKFQIDPKSIWANATFNGKLRITRGSLRGIQFESFVTSFLIKRGRIVVKKFQALAPGGFVTSRGWINLRSKQGISFKWIPRIHELDMTNAIPIHLDHGKTPVLSGALSLDGIIVGGGSSVERIMRSLRGDLRLRASNGCMYGLKALKGKGLSFNHAAAQILIRRGVASTRDFYLDSEEISLAIEGRADLNDQSLDLHIGVRPLQTVDKILSNVPLAGWLLAGKDRSILTFSFRVKGKFDDLRLVSRRAQHKESPGRN